MNYRKKNIVKKTTFKVLLTTLIGVWMTNFLYSFVLPQTLLMDAAETSAFYKRTFLLTITIGSLAVFVVYLFYKTIEKALKNIEIGIILSDEEYLKVERAFLNIETLLFTLGALSYFIAILINITLEIISKKEIDYKYWIFRTVLALSFGILNGIAIGRLINYAFIDAKNLLKIKYIKSYKQKSRTINKLITPSILLLLVNICFFTIAIFNFYEKYAFTFLKFSFILKHFLVFAVKFLITDLVIFIAIFLEHQKHLEHIYKQFDIMANGEMDLSNRVHIISFDDIGFMISNVNNILNKLQSSFIKVEKAEKLVSDMSQKVNEEFLVLKDESSKISTIIKEIQHIEANETEIINKTNNDFNTLIISIENAISKYKYQSDLIEQTSVSMKNILNSFQGISRLTIETNQLFESLAANVYKGENQVSKLNEVNKKIIESNNEIQQITKLILDISDRSNLLAMNAAIEAAHAGDAGVGFSVVAEEMRKLSEITSNSASQIESIIKNIVESNIEAEEANKLIEDLFKQIKEQLIQTSSKMQEVSKNAESQIKQIDTNIVEVEKLITINEEIKESTEKMTTIKQVVIDSLNELQKSTKSLIESNNVMIESVEKMNNSVDFTSNSFYKMVEAIGNLREILSQYKIGTDEDESAKLLDNIQTDE